VKVCSLQFLLLVPVLCLVYACLPGRRSRQALLGLANAGFLFLLIPNFGSWVGLTLFLLSGYAVAAYLHKRPNRAVFALYVSGLILCFVVLKKYAFVVPFLPSVLAEHTVGLVGLSYMLFRQIHFIVDTMEGQAGTPQLRTYVNYQLNLFAILAGPIQRYQDFEAYWRAPALSAADTHDVLMAYIRVFIGILKIGLVAAACLHRYEASIDRLIVGGGPESALEALFRLALVFYLYPLFVYFNFSGYCDVVVGAGSLVGQRLPENFNRPYLARNMIEFWTRWHITLGAWIRDYLFTPMYKACAERWPGNAARLAFACYFVAFFVVGVWHGATWNFVVFGLLNAVGVSAAKLWEAYLIRSGGRKRRREYLGRAGVRRLATVLTYHYVCLALAFFPTDMGRVLQAAMNVAGKVFR